jgi:predicted nucleic acid-binding protein
VILLDTNVVSQAMKPTGDRAVRTWLNARDDLALFLCTPVFAELSFGVEQLPASRRRDLFAESLARIETAFLARILPFDMMAATRYGRLRALPAGRAQGMRTMDLMIAAIALTHDLTLATRNVRDFEGLGVRLVNPFEA